MGLFAGLKDAPKAGNYKYINPGDFVLSLKKVAVTKKRKGGHIFVSEWKVLEVVQEDDVKIKFRKGDTLSWTADFVHDLALDNIRKMLSAAAVYFYREMLDNESIEPSDVYDSLDEDDVNALLEDDGKDTIVGVVVKAHASNIVTNSGNDFTVVDWDPVASSVEEYEALTE